MRPAVHGRREDDAVVGAKHLHEVSGSSRIAPEDFPEFIEDHIPGINVKGCLQRPLGIARRRHQENQP